MTCPSCQIFAYIPIETPQDLNRIIAMLKHAKQMKNIRSVGTTYGADPFEQLNHNCWNDTVSNYFTCSHCAQHFHLSAETYHGSGGQLKAIQTLPEHLDLDRN